MSFSQVIVKDIFDWFIGVYFINFDCRLGIDGGSFAFIDDLVIKCECMAGDYFALLSFWVYKGLLLPSLEFFFGNLTVFEHPLFLFQPLFIADIVIGCYVKADQPGVETNQVRV